MPQYSFPEKYQSWIEHQLKKMGYSLLRPKDLAQAIQATSDYFISPEKTITPWQDNGARAAYLAYYFPLNYMRLQKVIAEGNRLGFFQNLHRVVDYGCGPGTASKALADGTNQFTHFIGIDQEKTLKELYQLEGRQYSASFFTHIESPKPPFLLTLSYALNELSEWVPWFDTATAILLIEPSTHPQAQALKHTRRQLIDKGFYIWGPCLHQEECPLLGSKKDWCHDRVYWQMPSWFSEIEENLPIKNASLTFSYLLARKEPPPQQKGMRIIGDIRQEKGKSRWLICQPGERLFLSGLHRKGALPEIYRGDIVQVEGLERKANEWRLSDNKIDKITSLAKSPIPE